MNTFSQQMNKNMQKYQKNIHQYKNVIPIEEYVTISKKYNDKRKFKIPKFKVTKNNIHEEEYKARSNVTGDEDEIKKE